MLRRYIVTGIVLLFLLSSIIPIASSNLINEWIYDEDTGTWSIEFSGELKESLILKYGLIELSQVGVIYSHEYSFPDSSQGYIEASYNRGESWNVVKEYNESSTDVRDLFVSLPSESIWVRYTVESHSGTGYWRIWDTDIVGDTRGTPPKTYLLMTGYDWLMWFQSYKKLTFVSEDMNGVKEIHCILDGKESVVHNNRFTITLGNGIHYFSYWAVDIFGNEEMPHIFPRPIRIDADNPPQIKIKYPEKGLYIFNEKMPFSIDKTIIIGGFDIEVFAYDNVSGIYDITYILDGEIINYATEEPYARYCGIKHNGYVVLEILAQDWAGNVAVDTLDIYYYNFF